MYHRVKNLGNYESERLEASAELDEREDVDEAIEALKSTVNKCLGIEEKVKDEEIIF